MEERKWKESKESKGSWKGGRRKEGKTMPVFGYELVMFYTILLIMSIDSIQLLLLDHERMNFHLFASANTIGDEHELRQCVFPCWQESHV